MIYLLVTLILASSANQAVGQNVNYGFDKLLDMTVSFLIGQHSEDSSVTPKHQESFLMKDDTNEDIANYTPQEIIARSGYKYENHFVTTDDGYITNMIRIINPLVERRHLKQPPVMMMHGGLIDYTVWIWSSAIQHRPEKYPRVAEDGPIVSWNKSLAFTLSNNGYDVWLVGSRGSNIFNKGHTSLKNHYNWFDQIDFARLNERNQRQSNSHGGHNDDEVPDVNFRLNFPENLQYWNYTMDDLVKYEVPRQLQRILQVTGAEKVSLVDLSLSTQLNLALMAEDPAFVSRVHNYVTIAPILNNRGTNLFIRLFHTTLCTRTPYTIGTILHQVALSPVTRKFTALLNSFRQLRYIIIKQLTRVLSGPSAKFETNLDNGVWGHILESTGFKHTMHYCQQCVAGQIQKFDFGTSDNLRVYGQAKPPAYELDRIEMPDWMVVSSGNDKAATVSSVKQLLRSVRRKPNKHVHIKRYNHLDLIAGFENDKFVNLPILEFLDDFALAPKQQQQQHHFNDNDIDSSSSSSSSDFRKLTSHSFKSMNNAKSL